MSEYPIGTVLKSDYETFAKSVWFGYRRSIWLNETGHRKISARLLIEVVSE